MNEQEQTDKNEIIGHGNEDENKEGDTAPTQKENEQIKEMGSITAKGKHVIHCLTIIGQIEGHYALSSQNKTTKYEHVIPQLVAVEQTPDIEGLLILLNTVGGDVEAGLALAELVSGMTKPTVSLVLGGGHSIGVPLAVSAKRSFIAPSASMTLHPVRMSGLVIGVPQTLYYFEKMQDRIDRFVTENSHISPERFKELCMNTGELVTDIGTVLDGEAAVAEGLIDELGSLSQALACLYEMIEKDAPEKEKEEAEPAQKNSAGKKRRSPAKKEGGKNPQTSGRATAQL